MSDDEVLKKLLVKMEESKVISTKERANSYETGKSGDRFKLQFDTAKELQDLINSLREAGFSIDTTSE